MWQNVDKSIYYLLKCDLNLSECGQNFPFTENIKMPLKPNVDKMLDKLAWICCIWSKVGDYGLKWGVAQLHIYLYVDK